MEECRPLNGGQQEQYDERGPLAVVPKDVGQAARAE
jgi:hypothetical protein